MRRRYFTKDPLILVPAAAAVGIALSGLIALPSGRLSAILFWLIAMPPQAAFGIRGAMLGVEVEETGLKVVNVWRTVTVRWDEINDVYVTPGTFNPGFYATIELTDGSLIRATGVSHRWLSTIERAKQARCGRMTAELRVIVKNKQGRIEEALGATNG